MSLSSAQYRTSDPAWFDDVRVLATRWHEFFPKASHTHEERLNSLVRLCAYLSVALFAYTGQAKLLAVGLGSAAALSVAAYGGGGRWRTGGGRGPPPPVDAGFELYSGSGGGACQLPTRDNPFANHLVTDDPDRPPACEYDAVKDRVRHAFNAGLPRNVFDVHEKENSQRQYHTMPVTTAVGDSRAFAEFCYATPPSRKEMHA